MPAMISSAQEQCLPIQHEQIEREMNNVGVMVDPTVLLSERNFRVEKSFRSY